MQLLLHRGNFRFIENYGPKNSHATPLDYLLASVEQQCKEKATATAKDVPPYEHFYTQAKCGHDLQRQVYADDTDHADLSNRQFCFRAMLRSRMVHSTM
jgi:hypothetical protein